MNLRLEVANKEPIGILSPKKTPDKRMMQKNGSKKTLTLETTGQKKRLNKASIKRTFTSLNLRDKSQRSSKMTLETSINRHEPCRTSLKIHQEQRNHNLIISQGIESKTQNQSSKKTSHSALNSTSNPQKSSATLKTSSPNPTTTSPLKISPDQKRIKRLLQKSSTS